MLSSIVVGTDGSESANEAVATAVDIARKYGASLHLVSVHKPRPDAVTVPMAGASVADTLRGALEAEHSKEVLAATIAGLGDLQAQSHAEVGDPAEGILSVANAVGADLIVVGSKGMNRRILGSVPNTVAHNAPCAVLIVKTV